MVWKSQDEKGDLGRGWEWLSGNTRDSDIPRRKARENSMQSDGAVGWSGNALVSLRELHQIFIFVLDNIRLILLCPARDKS